MIASRLTLILPLLLILPIAAEAQVGIRSDVAQLALMARSPTRGSVRGIEPAQQTVREGGMVELSMVVRVSANTGYHLLVRGTSVSGSKIWVRDANGVYQELTTAKPVMVARETHCAGESERQVHYRVEVREGEQLGGSLPVRYDMAINPTM